MRLKSNLCLLFLAASFFLTVAIQYSCTDPIEDQPEENEKQEEKQDGEGEFIYRKMYLLNDINDTINITRVIMLDDTVGNGVVHVLDHVIDYTRK